MKALLFKLAITAGLALFSTSCATVSNAKYSALEKIGFNKREILVTNVTKARDAQSDAKEEFKDALEQFSEVLNFDGGELQKKYTKLSKVLDRSEGKANAVKSRIDKVEDVADALFREWKSEMKAYNNNEYRKKSEKQYNQSFDRYNAMLGAMKRAESKIDPVLRPLRDQVLFLKHNLNAAAIASLKKELGVVETDVADLIKELEKAISEADEYIREMNAG